MNVQCTFYNVIYKSCFAGILLTRLDWLKWPVISLRQTTNYLTSVRSHHRLCSWNKYRSWYLIGILDLYRIKMIFTAKSLNNNLLLRTFSLFVHITYFNFSEILKKIFVFCKCIFVRVIAVLSWFDYANTPKVNGLEFLVQIFTWYIWTNACTQNLYKVIPCCWILFLNYAFFLFSFIVCVTLICSFYVKNVTYCMSVSMFFFFFCYFYSRFVYIYSTLYKLVTLSVFNGPVVHQQTFSPTNEKTVHIILIFKNVLNNASCFPKCFLTVKWYLMYFWRHVNLITFRNLHSITISFNTLNRKILKLEIT